jgi:hypothetical protein
MAESSDDSTVVPFDAAVAAPASSELKVQDVQIDRLDCGGRKIRYIYASLPGQYAIYKAEKSDVLVHFSDDPNSASAQRKNIAPLGPDRAELNSLLVRLPGRGRGVFDHKLAHFLLLALNGDLEGAKTGLSAAISGVLTQREAAGRVQYLTWSYGAAAVMLGLLFVGSEFYRFDQPSNNLWLAGKAGLVGAAFSIALAVRGRASVALDIEFTTNLMDGTLRLLIGVVSAGVLLMLLASGILPVIKVGDATLSGTGLTWQTVLVIGFVAGFLERLVPDLLEKKNTQEPPDRPPRT